MTSKKENPFSGPPPPITELTLEQDLKLRQLELSFERKDVKMEDIATVFLALQRQNFVLCNSITNLIDKWPTVPTTTKEVPAMFGILSGNKD